VNTSGGLAVTLAGYLRYAGHRIGAAVVRRSNEQATRVVSLWKLARPRRKPGACERDVGQLTLPSRCFSLEQLPGAGAAAGGGGAVLMNR
jgi:hypothetical protein